MQAPEAGKTPGRTAWPRPRGSPDWPAEDRGSSLAHPPSTDTVTSDHEPWATGAAPSPDAPSHGPTTAGRRCPGGQGRGSAGIQKGALNTDPLQQPVHPAGHTGLRLSGPGWGCLGHRGGRWRAGPPATPEPRRAGDSSRPRSCPAWTSWPCPGRAAPSQGPVTQRRPPPAPACRAQRQAVLPTV